MSPTTGAVGGRHSSASNEHYTPRVIVEAARTTLGAIDLDPASCEAANRVVRATRIFTRADDGLSRPWHGRVFNNPPGGRLVGGDSSQKTWWFKLGAEWHAGRADAAIFVSFSIELFQTAQVDTPADLPTPLDLPFCVPSSRVAYMIATEQIGLFSGAPELKEGASPPHASAIVFFPPRVERAAAIDRFRAAFGPIGKVVLPLTAPSGGGAS